MLPSAPAGAPTPAPARHATAASACARPPASPAQAAAAAPAREGGAVSVEGRRADMTLERRRARTMVGATVVFVGLVLLTSFPLSGVLSQRSALSGAAHELATVQAQNDGPCPPGLGSGHPGRRRRARPARLRLRPQGPTRLRHPALVEPVGLRPARVGPGVVERAPGGARLVALPGPHRDRRSCRGHGARRARAGARSRRARAAARAPSPAATGPGWSRAWSSGAEPASAPAR